MIGRRRWWIAPALAAVASVLTPGTGLAQKAPKRPQASKPANPTDSKSIDPTPQEMFARLFAFGPSAFVGGGDIPYGAGVGPAGVSRAESLSALGTGSEARRKGTGPRGLTPREARLVVRENQLLTRQAALIARLQTLESQMTALSIETRTTQLQKAEAKVVDQLKTTQAAIVQNLSVLAQMAPNAPQVQAEYQRLATQAVALAYQAVQVSVQGGFSLGDRFPATASR